MFTSTSAKRIETLSGVITIEDLEELIYSSCTCAWNKYIYITIIIWYCQLNTLKLEIKIKIKIYCCKLCIVCI